MLVTKVNYRGATDRKSSITSAIPRISHKKLNLDRLKIEFSGSLVAF